jgi:hypothetical protein
LSDAPLTLEDFAGSVGCTLSVETESGSVALALIEASALPPSAREGGSFRLELEGPLQPELEQRIYTFDLERGPTEIFIVPIARTESAMRYEAIFF